MNNGLSTNYCLKSHIERIFGNKRFLEIKDYPSFSTWKKTLILLTDSYNKAIKQSVKVAPISFRNELKVIYNHYCSLVKKSTNEEELFSTVVAFQSEIIFSLLGNIDNYIDRTLSSSWDLTKCRETQIIQTDSQKYNEIESIVNKRFTMKQIEEFAQEKRKLEDNGNFFAWIFSKKMNSQY